MGSFRRPRPSGARLRPNSRREGGCGRGCRRLPENPAPASPLPHDQSPTHGPGWFADDNNRLPSRCTGNCGSNTATFHVSQLAQGPDDGCARYRPRPLHNSLDPPHVLPEAGPGREALSAINSTRLRLTWRARGELNMPLMRLSPRTASASPSWALRNTDAASSSPWRFQLVFAPICRYDCRLFPYKSAAKSVVVSRTCSVTPSSV